MDTIRLFVMIRIFMLLDRSTFQSGEQWLTRAAEDDTKRIVRSLFVVLVRITVWRRPGAEPR